jgi:hypothetical protein
LPEVFDYMGRASLFGYQETYNVPLDLDQACMFVFSWPGRGVAPLGRGQAGREWLALCGGARMVLQDCCTHPLKLLLKLLLNCRAEM